MIDDLFLCGLCSDLQHRARRLQPHHSLFSTSLLLRCYVVHSQTASSTQHSPASTFLDHCQPPRQELRNFGSSIYITPVMHRQLRTSRTSLHPAECSQTISYKNENDIAETHASGSEAARMGPSYRNELALTVLAMILGPHWQSLGGWFRTIGKLGVTAERMGHRGQWPQCCACWLRDRANSCEDRHCVLQNFSIDSKVYIR